MIKYVPDRLLAMFKQEEMYYYKNLTTTTTTQQQQQQLLFYTSKRFIDIRANMIHWCFKVIKSYKQLRLVCVEITMNYVDRYCALLMINNNNNNEDFNEAIFIQRQYPLIVITSLYITTKIHAKTHITLQRLHVLSKSIYTYEQIKNMEISILQTLQWRMNPPTAYSFAWEYLSILERYGNNDNITIKQQQCHQQDDDDIIIKERKREQKIENYQNAVCHIVPALQKAIYVRASIIAYYTILTLRDQYDTTDDRIITSLGQFVSKFTRSDTIVLQLMIENNNNRNGIISATIFQKIHQQQHQQSQSQQGQQQQQQQQQDDDNDNNEEEESSRSSSEEEEQQHNKNKRMRLLQHDDSTTKQQRNQKK